MKTLLKPILTLTVLSVLLCGVLVVVNQITSEVIKENQWQAELRQLEGLVDTTDLEQLCELGIGIREVKVQGYGGSMRIAVVVRDDEIVGVRALTHSETPGFADVLKPEDWIHEFTIRPSADVDAVTRTTITTRAVIRAVQEALENSERDDAC